MYLEGRKPGGIPGPEDWIFLPLLGGIRHLGRVDPVDGGSAVDRLQLQQQRSPGLIKTATLLWRLYWKAGRFNKKAEAFLGEY